MINSNNICKFDEEWIAYWFSYIRSKDKFLYICLTLISFFKSLRFMLPPLLNKNSGDIQLHSYALVFCDKFLNFSDYLNRLKGNTRRSYNKALKGGLVFTLVKPTEDNLREFKKFSKNEKNKNYASIPPIIMDGFHRHPGSRLIFIYSDNSQIVGIASVLIYANCLWLNWIITSEASNKKAGLTFFIYIKLVQFCFDNDIIKMNFGRSLCGSGVEKFKLNFGSELLYPGKAHNPKVFVKYSSYLLSSFKVLQNVLLYLKANRLYALLFAILT